MRRIAATAIALGICLVGNVAAGNGVVVTNPTPAVTATAELLAFDPGRSCYAWTITGKVKPSYRGHGASVSLVCAPYAMPSAAKVFGALQTCQDSPFCGADATNVDACGNFSFNVCDNVQQLDPSYLCHFVVHVDDSKAPQACGQKPVPVLDSPMDPNGSAPCSGGYCPNAP